MDLRTALGMIPAWNGAPVAAEGQQHNSIDPVSEALALSATVVGVLSAINSNQNGEAWPDMVP